MESEVTSLLDEVGEVANPIAVRGKVACLLRRSKPVDPLSRNIYESNRRFRCRQSS